MATTTQKMRTSFIVPPCSGVHCRASFLNVVSSRSRFSMTRVSALICVICGFSELVARGFGGFKTTRRTLSAVKQHGNPLQIVRVVEEDLDDHGQGY